MRSVGLDALTRRQGHVLALVARGLLNKQIAFELGISEATVKAHVSAILRKFDVPNRREAIDLAARCGMAAPGMIGRCLKR